MACKALLFILLSIYLASVLSIDVSVPLNSPSNAQPRSQTLVSFSIEQDRWPDWTGIDAPNEFAYNALKAFGDITGVPPKIWVGADSEDHTIWFPTVTTNDLFPPPSTITPYPEATSIVVGNGFYELSKVLPPGTHITWGVNLGLDNVTNAMNMARSIVKTFGTAAVIQAQVTLDMIELGNGAGVYQYTGFRNSSWDAQAYVDEWISIAGPVAEAANLSSQGVTFQGGSLTGLVFASTQHRYSSIFCSGGDFPLISFMSKVAVRSNLSLWVTDITTAHDRGLRYVLGETGSITCHGAPGVSNTAGATPWVIDYAFQASSLGISDVYFHEGIGFNYNFFQPIRLNRATIDGSPLDTPQPAHVQPSYYAAILINTFIGSTRSAEIVELIVPDDNVSGYAAFENGILKRMVFVNLHAWLASSEGTGVRPSVQIGCTFTSISAQPQSAKAKRLVIRHADDLEGLTFGGQSFETGNAKPIGIVVDKTVDLQQGISLNATQAILIIF